MDDVDVTVVYCYSLFRYAIFRCAMQVSCFDVKALTNLYSCTCTWYLGFARVIYINCARSDT